jgi:hypothetical protein
VLEWFSPAGTHNNCIQEEDTSAEKKRQTSFLVPPPPPHEPKKMNFKLFWCRKLDNAGEKMHLSTIFFFRKKDKLSSFASPD